MQLLIAAGVPSAIVAFCFWLLERRIQERAEAEKDERARRQKEQDDKPNYPLLLVVLLMAGIFWPLVILFAVFVPLTFLLMDKMGQLHPKDDDEMDPEEDTYL